MAKFSIEFASGEPRKPTYDSFVINNLTFCGTDPIESVAKFNDNSQPVNYVFGWNWDNPDTGLPAQSVKLLSFSDKLYERDESTGVETEHTPHISNYLYDASTGSSLTYPYIIPISKLSDLKEALRNNAELICIEQPIVKIRTVRRRIIHYTISDSSGVEGPERTTEYINIQQQ